MYLLPPGELFFIGYQMDKQPPCVWYASLDKEGKLQFDVRVDLKEGVMMHDMAITEAGPPSLSLQCSVPNFEYFGCCIDAEMVLSAYRNCVTHGSMPV